MKLLIIAIFNCFTILTAQLFINEIDYDQPGSDSNEFIEIAGQAGTYENVTIELINGNSNSVYGTIEITSLTLSDQVDGYGFHVEYYSGIQNGAPDGVQLSVGGIINDAVAYEGSLNDTNGNPMEEAGEDYQSSTEEAQSLSRLGLDETAWEETAITPGSINTNQVMSTDIEISGCTDPEASNYNPNATTPCNGDNSCCEYPQVISIYDIQMTTEDSGDCFDSPYSGQTVTTTGIITAVKPGSSPNFYLQSADYDSYAGVYIFDDNFAPFLGDEIVITAGVSEYFGFTELTNLASYSVNSSGNSITPKEISTGELAGGCTMDGEALEGMLVKISNVSVTIEVNQYGEWFADDGSGACQLDDNMFDGEWENPSVGQEFNSIVGVVDYAYGEFAILPRVTSDFQANMEMPVADAGADQTVEPGSQVTLNGSASYDPNGSIAAYEWAQTSGPSVVLSDEESAITSFTAPEGNAELVFQLTVWDNDWNEAADEVVVTIMGVLNISDIQMTSDPGTGQYDCYPSPYYSQLVVVSGVVTAVKPGSNPNFYLSEPNASTWGGVYVYDNTVSPQFGDELVLNCEVEEYFGFTELTNVTSFSVESAGNSVSPTAVSTGDLGLSCSESGEIYEGMLVQIIDAVVDSVDEFSSIYLDDGSGSTKLDDYFFDGDWPAVAFGDYFGSVVGVVEYSYGEFAIMPRTLSDFDDTADPCTGILQGDANLDGAINVLDIVTIVNHILGVNPLTGCSLEVGDYNNDDAINVLDIVGVVNYILDN